MKKIFVLAFSLVVLIGAVFLLSENPVAVGLPDEVMQRGGGEDLTIACEYEEIPLTLEFSETGHFHESGIYVEIFASNPYAQIHYTLDGAFPTTNSAIHNAPISLNAGRGVEAVVLRAIAVYDGEVSAPLTHTYFIGDGVFERFDTLVFSLSTNPDYLFCFYEGILVYGITRQEHIRANPGQYLNPTAPANFNWRGRESERPINVEVFSDGERVLAQAAGVRVFGSWSRGENVKSLRLIARREYSPDAGRFHYNFFPDEIIHDGFDTPLGKYNTLILRNGGNDRQHGMIRNELGSVLSRRAGFNDVTPVRAATVFINGEFFGFKWLQTRVDEHYFQEIYNTPNRDFDVVSRGEWWFRNATEEQIEALTYKNNFAFRDLTDDAEFARLNEIVDIDNLLFYYAFQIFSGNGDWPHNNLRRWRYIGEPFVGMAPELDGRWRYAIWDLDQTWGLFGQNYRRPTFQYLLIQNNDRGQLLRAIVQRQDMAERFVMIFNDIAANVINEQIVRDVIDELFAASRNELRHTVEAGLFNHWISMHTFPYHHGHILDFARRRASFINLQLSRFFDFEDNMGMFDVSVSGGEAIIGTQRGTRSRYFEHLTIPVSPVLPHLTAFDHWLVNGIRVEQENIYVSFADAVNGVVNLELVTRHAPPPLLIYYAGELAQSNGLVLINPTNYPVRTDDFFLSNRREELDRFPIPRATIEPGGTLELAGRGSRSPEDLFRIQMDFNVRQGRRVFLSDENGNILDTKIPQ
ncbi:MAG: CotH kinase family protein [Defluviitaleaceae bacterium]|nr:CotH kinase family protein [Defluviitaleaceae bacterium]